MIKARDAVFESTAGPNVYIRIVKFLQTFLLNVFQNM